MKLLLFSGLLVCFLACAQKSSIWKNTKRDGYVLLGKASLGKLFFSDSFPWLTKGIAEYPATDTAALSWIKQNKARLSFEVYAATWCSDTWNLLPKFFKVLGTAQIHHSKVPIYLLNRRKHLPHWLIRPWGVRSVPMFIVKLDGSVMGRIVESLPAGVSMEMAIRNCCDKR
ncbi:MAG: hypothetical protein EXR21_05930 [Flavobacteriaceae bacterium]|nr:hypothetical protein [Flavobacteriaceae bacterium]